MNVIDYFSAVLKTNKDFDKTLINQYIGYFLDQTKFADLDLSNYLQKPQYMFDLHLEELIEQGVDASDYLHSNLYGFDDLECQVTYDAQGNCIETSVITDSGEKPRWIFSLDGFRIEAINDRSNKLFFKGKVICINNDDKYGIVDKFGKIVVPPIYDFICTPPLGDYLVACQGNKCGIIDLEGNIKIPFEYDNIISERDKEMALSYVQTHGFIDGYWVTMKDNLYGVIDKNLHTTYECVYQNIYSLETDYFDYRYDSYFLLQNDKGNFALYHPKSDTQTEYIWGEVYFGSFSFFIPFRKEKYCGFYDLKKQKEILLDFIFDLDAFLVNDKRYIQIKDKTIGKYAIFDLDFNQLTDFMFELPIGFNQRNLAVLLDVRNCQASSEISIDDFFRLYGLKRAKSRRKS